MGSENEDRCFPANSEELYEASQAICKQSTISYTRDFLLSLAELDTSKKLPCGLDQSILSEFYDAPASITILESQRVPASASLPSFRTSNYVSLQSSCDSDYRRRYGNQDRHSWKNPQHDGILGNGANPRVSGFTSGSSAPTLRGNGLLSKSKDPYRPPRPHKEAPYSWRQSSDTSNDDTFDSAECMNQEREEEWRRASFELTRQEQQKAIHEKQEQTLVEHNENSNPNPDTATLLGDSRKGKSVEHGCNESEESVASPATNKKSSNSFFSTQITAPKSLVYSGCTSRICGKSPGAECLTPVSEVGKVKLEVGFSCSRSYPVENIVSDNNEEKQSDNYIVDQLRKSKGINSPYRSEGKSIVVTSSDSEIPDSIVDIGKASSFSEVYVAKNDKVANTESVTGDKSMDMPGQDHSTTILENLFGSASSVNISGPSSFIKDHNAKANCTSHSSKFAHLFIEEEENPGGDDKNVEWVYGRALEENPPILNSERKEMTHKTMISSSIAYGIPEDLNIPGFITCEDVGQSIVSETDEGSSSHRQFVIGGQSGDDKRGDAGLSQNLLSLLHKATSSKDVEENSSEKNPSCSELDTGSEKNDLRDEICLPDEDSLITVEDLCGSCYDAMSTKLPVCNMQDQQSYTRLPHSQIDMHSQFQQMQMANQMSCYTQELQSYLLNCQQPNGYGVQNTGHGVNQMHPFNVTGGGGQGGLTWGDLGTGHRYICTYRSWH